VESDWTFLNRRLAQHYGIPNVESWDPEGEPYPKGRSGRNHDARSVLNVKRQGTNDFAR